MSKAAKKIRDKWRLKEWYNVFTPSYFGDKNVSNIPSEDPMKLIGRVVETTLYDITADFSHQSTKLYFLITSTAGNRAETILKSHEYSTDYLRSLVRRGSTRIDGIFTGQTPDKYLVRVYVTGACDPACDGEGCGGEDSGSDLLTVMSRDGSWQDGQ